MEKQKNKTQDTDNFFGWVRHEKYAIGLALFCTIIPILSEVKWESIYNKGTFNIIKLVLEHELQYQFANILLIIISLYLLAKMPFLQNKDNEKIQALHNYVRDTFGENSTLARNTPEELFKRINTGIKQFYFSWVSVWVIWLIMYITKFVYTIYTINRTAIGMNIAIDRLDHLLENSLNLIGSFILFFIYMDITVSTVNVGTLTGKGRTNMQMGVFTLILLGSIIFTADLFSIFQLQEHYHITQFYLRLLIGLIATTSVMAVLGRLNTSYLKIPQSLIMYLYLYAAVQMFYPLIYKAEDTHITPNTENIANPIIPVYTTNCSVDFNSTFNEKKEHLEGKPHNSSPSIPQTLDSILGTLVFLGKGCLLLVLQWISRENRFMFFLIHKANSLSESRNILRRFKRYYEGCPDK